MLRREGQALVRHPHRHLARCHAFLELPPDFPGLAPGYTRSAPALVLELLEDGSLHRLLRRQQLAPWRPLYDTAAALEWSTQLAEALAHLHSHSIIHRDVKADNVMLSNQQQQQQPQQQPTHKKQKQHQQQQAGPLSLLVSSSSSVAAAAAAAAAAATEAAGSKGGGEGPRPVVKLVDLGLHSSPPEERHRRQPLFRLPLTLGGGRPSGSGRPSGGTAVDADGRLPPAAASSTTAAPTSYGGDVGADGVAVGIGEAAFGSRGLVTPSSPPPPPQFVTPVQVQGRAILVPVDPYSPWFRNLDQPLLPLPLAPPPSPPPPPTTPPLTAAAAAARQTPTQGRARVPFVAAPGRGEVAESPAPPPPRPASNPMCTLMPQPQPRRSCGGGGGVGGGGGGVSPLMDAYPGALPSVRTTPTRRRGPAIAAALAAAAASSGYGDGGGDCGSLAGSVGVTEMGLLCSVISGCSLRFFGMFSTSELGGGGGGGATEANDRAWQAAASSPVSYTSDADAAPANLHAGGGGGGGCARRTAPPATAQRHRQQQQKQRVYGTTTAVQCSGDGRCSGVGQRACAGGGGSGGGGGNDGCASDGSGASSQQPHGQIRALVQASGKGDRGGWYGGTVRQGCVSSICRPGGPGAREVPFPPPPPSSVALSSSAHERPSYVPYTPSPRPGGGGGCGDSSNSQQLSLLLSSDVDAVLPYEKVFRLTGETGSCMTMAPEVWKALPYNDKADVFSFGVVMYELFAHSLLLVSHIGVRRPELPHNVFFSRCEQYTEAVSRGFRPARLDSIPPPVWTLVTQCWDQDPAVRPPMAEVVQRLKAIAETNRAEAAAAAAEAKRVAAAATAVAGRSGAGGGGGVCGGGGTASFSGGAGGADGEAVSLYGAGGSGGCAPGCQPGCVIS
ncbi:hypothetical protein PLESTB_000431500 [Pleodorina starrii]|uniref:Protein kinase domain-containing protein n=1 Tax=Pleodorina starrii TaxID=330485 RepID=A0A9W6BFG6_9CHLO|nr:hypothetical protein PLESTM_001692000 [Pleodorina starrii]GLC50783.1 hypothetical protein PLESTB_000431500 [Pleodorina starrii]